MARGLTVEIVGDASKLNKATKSAQGDLERLGSSALKASGGLGSIGTALAGGSIVAAGAALFKMSNDANDAALQVGKLSRITGESARDMSTLAFAARMTNVDMDVLTASLGIAAKNMEAGKFEKFGISAHEANGSLRGMGETLGAVADRFQQLGNGPEQTALAMQLFGRAGKDMIPILSGGSEGLAKYAEEAKKFGLVIDESAIKRAKEAKKAQRELSAAWDGLTRNLVSNVGPAFTAVFKGAADKLTDFRAITTGFSDQMDELRDNQLKAFKSDAPDEYAARLGRVGNKINDLQGEWEKLGRFDGIEANGIRNQIGAYVSASVAAAAYQGKVEGLMRARGMSLEAAKAEVDAEEKKRKAAEDAANGISDAAEETSKYAEKTRDLAEAWDSAKSAQDKYLGKATSLIDAQLESKDAWQKVVDTIGKNGSQFNWVTGQIDLNTAAGRENFRVYEDLVKKLADEDLARAKDANSIEVGRQALERHRTELINSMVASGMSRQAAENYANQLGLIPKDIVTTWRQDGLDVAIAKVNDLARSLGQAGARDFIAGVSAADRAVASVRGHAAGTNWASPGFAMVGEHGPELMSFGGGERVIDHRTTERILSMGSSGPGTVTVQLVVEGRVFEEMLVDLAARR